MANWTGLTFDSNSLQTANILTNDIAHYGLPTKIANMFTLAHENKSAIPFTSYPAKTIVVSGTIIDTSIAALDSRLDTFRNYFGKQDANLDIDYNSGTRRYIATVNSLSIDRPGGLLYANFTIEFICTSPFGQDTATTTLLSAAGRTLSGYTDAVTVNGTAPYQLPTITITLTAVSSTGSQYLFFGNNGNGQGITIARSTWATNDVIVIDCVAKTVTVNGIAANFSGAFPEFPPGAQSLGYTDSFTTRTFTISAVYYPLYL